MAGAALPGSVVPPSNPTEKGWWQCFSKAASRYEAGKTVITDTDEWKDFVDLLGSKGLLPDAEHQQMAQLLGSSVPSEAYPVSFEMVVSAA